MDVNTFLSRNSLSGSILIFILIALSSTASDAASVTLRWDGNNPAPDGYRVFARRGDQAYNYSQPDWEGSSTNCTIDDLEDQTEYFFVVRAYKDIEESTDSPETHYTPSDSISSGQDSAAPFWDGATIGVGLASETATNGCVIVEFDTASDAIDGTDLKYNIYYAPEESWNDGDWASNSVMVDAVVDTGSTFSHAVTISGLRSDISYTIGVRVEDQSGNEDGNTISTTTTSTGPKRHEMPIRY